MFGQNPIRPQRLDDGQRLQVESVFLTIQGEGPLTGVPAVFVRLAGCWLACHFCDTQFEAGINNYQPPHAVLDLVRLHHRGRPCNLVVLTGGDPLRQNIVPLVHLLEAHDYHVQIETAGLRWVPDLENFLSDYPTPGASLVVSPKTGKVCSEVSRYASAWKYIVDLDDPQDPHDGLPNGSTQVAGMYQKLARPPHDLPRHKIFLQPCDRGSPRRNKENSDLALSLAYRYGYRVSVQTHKILGVE